MNFFTLSFDKNKNFFLISILSIFLIYFASFIYLNYISKKDPNEVYLSKYHLDKIKEKDYSVVFLGDSTLGYSINADYWYELSKEEALSLAMWGDISFEGHFYLLNKLNFNKIKKIYIMTGLDIWINDPELSKKQVRLLDDHINNKSLIYPSVITLKNALRSKPKIVNDYIKNNKRNLTPDDIRKISIKNLIVENIQFSHLENLKKIFKICEDNNFKCYHLNGPIHSKFCNNQDIEIYMEKIYNFFTENKIVFNKKIPCIKQFELGNSWTHPHSNYKKKFTKFYYSLIPKD